MRTFQTHVSIAANAITNRVNLTEAKAARFSEPRQTRREHARKKTVYLRTLWAAPSLAKDSGNYVERICLA
jgi:hypothetical protein